MKFSGYHGGGWYAIRPYKRVTHPNTGASVGIWAKLEVTCGTLLARVPRTFYAQADLDRFVRELRQFALDRTGEILLSSSFSVASLRIFEYGLARHVALEARVIHRHSLENGPIVDTLTGTLELDPSRLVKYADELDGELTRL